MTGYRATQAGPGRSAVPAAPLPHDVVAATRGRYVEAFGRLTGTAVTTKRREMPPTNRVRQKRTSLARTPQMAFVRPFSAAGTTYGPPLQDRTALTVRYGLRSSSCWADARRLSRSMRGWAAEERHESVYGGSVVPASPRGSEPTGAGLISNLPPREGE